MPSGRALLLLASLSLVPNLVGANPIAKPGLVDDIQTWLSNTADWVENGMSTGYCFDVPTSWSGSPPDLNLKAPPFHYQDPKRNTLDLLGIYFAQGTATFSCDTGCGMPSGAEAKCPAKWQHLEATLYDVGDRLHQDNDFAVKFLNRQTDGSDYLSTLEPGAPTGEIGRMTDNGPGPTIQLGDQVVFRTRINSGWMYSQPGSGPNGGTGRGWYQWGNSEVETGISDLYEVKTWGGDISDILCPTTKGQASAPYRSQLWLYGPRMNVALSGAITKPICDK